ncbi:MAG: DUF2442 domain-containing protein [Phycisphaerae bacterium]|nr:DUF2442 domain-containing protein [Phycisphaerae bacterium]
MADYDVVAVRALEGMQLQVRFADGVSGIVRLMPTHLYGVFAPLKDPAVFALASCENGFVSWPGEIDLAPDAMHEAIRAKGELVLR